MYGYGNPGNIWGILTFVIIGGAIVSFLIFLICRELICWYYKINKMVALMEEQNQLLRKILNKGTSHDYVVVADVNLRSKPNKEDSEILSVLHEGNEVLFLEKGDNVTNEGVTAPWFKVKSEEGIVGWCFSGLLKSK
jgi:hypothetical protein